MTQEQYTQLLEYKDFLDMSLNCSFVRMSQAQFKAIEDIYGHEDFNHSCRVCNLNYLRKVARDFNEFAKVLPKPEPKPVTTTVSEVKKNNTPKKVTNKTKDGRNKKNNTKKA